MNTMFDRDTGLKTDLYELTMAAGYFENKVNLRATFELSCYSLPPQRSYLIACGLEQAVDYLLNLRFTDNDIAFIKTLPAFRNISREFFEYLKVFKFTGDLWALSEGEVFFAHEPILQIDAPIIEAQIVETYLLSILNIESLVATKASRIVRAACGDGQQRGVIDFGCRRAHGPQAGVLAARAAYVGGCLGTSNVYAGQLFDIPLYGTMAHSWIEAFDREEDAFEQYHQKFPQNTILLVDTYNTIKAIEKMVRLPWKDEIKAIRLDSGDLISLSRQARKILDKNGLDHIKIIASGNLNEYKIQALIKAKASIDLFGVGTDMVTSRDCPALNLTYKLVQTIDQDNYVRLTAKRSLRKRTIPGRKQVFRKYGKNHSIKKDIIGLFVEKPLPETTPLLKPIIENGVLTGKLPSLKEIKETAQKNVKWLGRSYVDIKNGQNYNVELSKAVSNEIKHVGNCLPK